MSQMIAPAKHIIRAHLDRVLRSAELEEVSNSSAVGTPRFF
jgi:hypothetical protein